MNILTLWLALAWTPVSVSRNNLGFPLQGQQLADKHICIAMDVNVTAACTIHAIGVSSTKYSYLSETGRRSSIALWSQIKYTIS